MSPLLSAIRAKCLDCCGASPSMVKKCHITACTLHPYRMGKNPSRKIRQLSDDDKAKLRLRLAGPRLPISPEIEGENGREAP